MIGKIFGFILVAFLGVFAICSCKVASWADQEMEEDLKKKEDNKDEEVHS